jgi:hypothetical protein
VPNIAPRSLGVYDPAGVLRDVVQPWVYDTSGVRRVVLRAWGYDAAGARQLLWSSASTPPATVTAAFVPVGTSVTVTWTSPAQREANEWEVRRPDGSVVGRVPYTTLSLSDPLPRPLSGAYTVHGVLGTAAGAGTSSNSLDLRVVPASFVATYNSGQERVNFTGSAPAVGAPDDIGYWRNVDGSYIGSCVSAGGPCGFDPMAGRTGQYAGYSMTYLARGFLSGVASALSVNSGTVNIPPAPARIQYLVATGGLNGVQVGFWGPANGTWTNFQVEFAVSTGGPWIVAESANTSGIVNYTTTVPVYVRVRTNAPGGTTYTAPFGPATPQTDTTPPADVSWQSFKPEGSYGRMVARVITPPDLDLGYVQVERNVNGGGWVGVWASTMPPSAPLAVDVGTFGAGTTIQSRVYLADTNGNARYSSERSYTLAASPTFIAVDGTSYWEATTFPSGNYNPSFDYRPREGYNTVPSHFTVGLWYYGTRIADFAAGKSIFAAFIFVKRAPGGSAAAGMTWLALHNQVTYPGDGPGAPPGVYDGFPAGNQAIDQADWLGLPTEFREALQNGYATGRWGVATAPDIGKPYQVYYTNGEEASSGTIQFHHLG